MNGLLLGYGLFLKWVVFRKRYERELMLLHVLVGVMSLHCSNCWSAKQRFLSFLNFPDSVSHFVKICEDTYSSLNTGFMVLFENIKKMGYRTIS